MLCRGLKSFVGVVTMRKGETKDIDKDLATKYIAGGFVEAVEAETKQPAKTNKAKTKGGKS